MSKRKNIFVVLYFLNFVFCFGQHNATPKENAKLTQENSTANNNSSKVFTEVDVQAMPPGGLNSYRKYISSSFKLPEVDQTTKCTIIAKFVVEEDGSISNIMITKEEPRGLGLAKEFVRLLKESAKWTPGSVNGKIVKQYYTMPISIQIQGSDEVITPIAQENKEIQPLALKDSIVQPEMQPEPYEGFQKFYANVQKSIQVPETDLNGVYKTKVSFIVAIDGTLTDFKIVSESPIAIGLGQEVIRVLKTFPKWKPGSKKAIYILPVTTVIEQDPIPTTKKE